MFQPEQQKILVALVASALGRPDLKDMQAWERYADCWLDWPIFSTAEVHDGSCEFFTTSSEAAEGYLVTNLLEPHSLSLNAARPAAILLFAYLLAYDQDQLPVPIIDSSAIRTTFQVQSCEPHHRPSSTFSWSGKLAPDRELLLSVLCAGDKIFARTEGFPRGIKSAKMLIETFRLRTKL